MPDDLTPVYHRLAHAAALVGDFDGSPDRQSELLRWMLEAVREIARARGLQIEPRQPEPMPHHISRELWPEQGASPEAVCDRILTASEESLREQQAPGVCWDIDGDVPRLVPLRQATEAAAERGYPCAGCGKLLSRSEGGAIFTVCDECWVKRWPDGAEASAGPERVLQAGERRRAAEEPPIEAGAGFAPGELARPVWGGVEEREE